MFYDNYTIVYYFVYATVLLYITKIILLILTNILSIQMRPLHPARFFFTDAPDLETLGLKKMQSFPTRNNNFVVHSTHVHSIRKYDLSDMHH